MDDREICTVCGYVGESVKITKGRIEWEIILWLLMLLPGLLYSVWRLASRYYGCPECEKPDMIPVDSPVGRKLLKETSEFYPEEEKKEKVNS